MTVDDRCPLGKEKTEELWQVSKEYCEKEGGSHGPDHSERVYFLALSLGRELSARLDIRVVGWTSAPKSASEDDKVGRGETHPYRACL